MTKENQINKYCKSSSWPFDGFLLYGSIFLTSLNWFFLFFSLSLCLIYNRQINEAYFLTIRIPDSDFTIILIGSIHRHAGLLINNLQRFVVLRVLRDCWIRQRYEGRRDIGRGIKPCSHQKMLSMTRGTPSTSLIGLHVWFDVGWPKWKRHPAPEEDSNRKVNRNGGRWWKDRMEVNKKIIPFFVCVLDRIPMA